MAESTVVILWGATQFRLYVYATLDRTFRTAARWQAAGQMLGGLDVPEHLEHEDQEADGRAPVANNVDGDVGAKTIFIRSLWFANGAVTPRPETRYAES